MKPFFCQRIARITLLAFAMQLLLPFMANYHSANAQNLQPLFGEKILICTSEGFRLVSIDNVPDIPPATDLECGLCYLSSIGFTFKPSAAYTPLATQHTTQSLSIPDTSTHVARHIHHRPQGRAPPHSIV